MRVLVFGANGMLGHVVFRALQERYEVCGTVRSEDALRHFTTTERSALLCGIDATNRKLIAEAIEWSRADVVVNCVGAVKQLQSASRPLQALPLNALLPHILSGAVAQRGARLVHISTDCVFSGLRGNYCEEDEPDARDLYGVSKWLGEIRDQNHVITLRTSIIGRELASKHGLIEWFLSQSDEVRGFTGAFFSGVTTLELAHVIGDYVLPQTDLAGLFHVSSERIAKYDLLRLLASEYEHNITILPDSSLQVDRSLNGARFATRAGYVAPSWRSQLSALRAVDCN